MTTTPKDFKSMVHFAVEETNPSDFAAFLPTPELIKKGVTPDLPGSSGLGITPNANISLSTPQTPKERILGRKPKTGFEKPLIASQSMPGRFTQIRQEIKVEPPKPDSPPIKKQPQINRITKDTGFTATSPATSSRHHHGGVQCLKIIEGLNKPPTERYPGGRTNTKNAMPKQVVMVEKSKLPAGVKETSLLVQAEVLGFSRAVRDMVPIGILEPLKTLTRDDASNELIAVYQNSILRFSSHSHGQKLALRWTLFSGKHRICSLDSHTFQTITERGIQKQQKRKEQKEGHVTPAKKSSFKGLQKKRKLYAKKKWTLGEVKLLIDGLEKHGDQYSLILKEGKKAKVVPFDDSRTPEDLEYKHRSLLEG